LPNVGKVAHKVKLVTQVEVYFYDVSNGDFHD
jgi:hypothetical protein